MTVKCGAMARAADGSMLNIVPHVLFFNSVQRHVQNNAAGVAVDGNRCSRPCCCCLCLHVSPLPFFFNYSNEADSEQNAFHKQTTANSTRSINRRQRTERVLETDNSELNAFHEKPTANRTHSMNRQKRTERVP